MRRPRRSRTTSALRRSALALAGCLAATAAAAVGPPCRPCGGLRVDHPATLLDELRAEPRLEAEARLYVSWPVELDGTADFAAAAEVAGTGAVPWLRLVFRTPAPLAGNLERLENELQQARLATAALGERPHLQVVWQPGTVPAAADFAREYAFLVKRAAVAVGGASVEARVVSQPLPADVAGLEALYAEEVAAYLDGVALAPAAPEAHAAALRALTQLDPGKPVALDALPFPVEPADVLAEAAAGALSGFSLTLFDLGARQGAAPAPAAAEPGRLLAPLKLLAREFQGDLSYDPYSTPNGSGIEAWTFVRGEDLGLRVIARGPADAGEWKLLFSDRALRGAARVDPATGAARDLFGMLPSKEGLELALADPDRVTVLRFERLTASEIEGIAGLDERVDVLSERQLPVEEILRRLQAFEDAQADRFDAYLATNTTHLRFQVGTGAQTIETTFRGPYFFDRQTGFDWAWRDFLVNGVRWRGKTIPEIPLIQPEKATTLPVEITFTKEYRYRLRGTAAVRGRDCWVIDFEPAVAVEPGRSLYQGTVWVDREISARVQTRAVQLGLEGEVLSNEETTEFSPLDAAGRPAPWEAASYFLPTRVVGQQIWSILSATTVVEREILLTEVEIDPADFAARRQALLDSDLTMVRDTAAGLRYLVTDEQTGERVVQENFDLSRRFLVAGVFQDESQDFPLPLGGINWLWFDFKGTGAQVNVFFAGALVTVAITDPDFLGSKFDVGFDAFALAFQGTDRVFRDGREVIAEDVDVSNPNLDLKIGRPIGNFGKVDLAYQLGYANFSRSDDTAPEFIVPSDHLNHTFSLAGRYNRKGFRLRANASHTLRGEWDPWGLPGNPDFDPDDDAYTRWGVGVGKTWHLPKFLKFGAELEYVDGSQLDRFSKYEFGFFSDVSVHGYQSDKVRAEEALAAHLSYGLNVADVIRLDLVGDAAWATDRTSGLDDELLAGVGVVGTVVGPWKTVINMDVGVAVDGPDDGFSAFIAVLKLFK